VTWLDQFEQLIQEASLAPSVHNVQPALWRKTEAGIELHLNFSALVPIADPQGRDVEVSLGAALEGLAIASRRRGFDIQIQYHGRSAKPFATVTAIPSAQKDPLAEFVQSRQTYRGVFAKPTSDLVDTLETFASSHPRIKIVTDPTTVTALARLYDRSNLDFYREPAFLDELNEWLRFHKGHSRYLTDGLNRESMALDPITGALASVALRPAMFKILDKLKLTPLLITEAPQIKSATAIVFFTRPKSEANHESGRALYRAWLECESLGLAMCPISSLTDAPAARAQVHSLLQLAIGTEVLLAFRAGPKPTKTYQRARRPLKEITVNP
jgi:nitroreductase